MLYEVITILQHLAEREPPMVIQLPRQAGQKECRHAHLLSGVPEINEEALTPPPEEATLRVHADNERLAALAEEVAALRAELAAFKAEMAEFRAQFE